MKNIFHITFGTLLLFSCSNDSVKETIGEEKPQNKHIIINTLENRNSKFFYRENAELEISNLTNSTFNFTLNASYGANVEMLEGTARFINTNMANYSEDDCAIAFNISGDSLVQIEQSGNCDAGAGLSYSGKYSNKKEESSSKYILTEKGIFQTHEVEDKFKDLNEKDYENFVLSFEEVTEEESPDDTANA